MELTHLRYFEAIARLGTVTRAAAEQHIAQPSLSKALRGLESELGMVLFDRVGRRLELSDAGRTLLPYARRILQEVEAARAALQARADLTLGHVSLGVPPTIGTHLLPTALADFNQRHRGIELELHEAGASQLLRLLDAGKVDLAVVSVPVAQAAWTELFTEELVVAVAPTHRLAQHGTIAAADLAREAFILFPPGYELRQQTLDLCQSAGFAPRIVLDGGEMDTVLRLTAAGLGIAVVPQLALSDTPELIGLSVRDVQLQRTLGLIWHPERQLSPAARALQTLLLERLKL
ncbi:MAG: LysR family transcriptional regulator [Herpetosiphonaceae bacterium]|nr:LysR family transcriptional regulator [Herpetosiphonaceae bacterium]